MSSAEQSPATLPPVVKQITVRWAPEEAFRRFTEEIGSWWPMETHSVGQEKVETVVLEGRVGGRVYERHRDGAEHDWGAVTRWDPPRRLAFTWHPGREPETAQEVEVTFTSEGSGSRVDLVHRGWEKLPEKPEEMRAQYDRGWNTVLDRYVG